MLKQTKGFLVVLVVAVIAVSLVGGCVAKSEEKVVWRYNTYYSQGDFPEEGIPALVENVAERTNGRFVIEPHYSDELGYVATDLPRVLSAGILELSQVSMGYLMPDYPWAGGGQLPFLTPEGKTMEVAMAIRPEIEQLLHEELNVTLAAWVNYPDPYVAFWFKETKPMSVSDFKGMKFRVWNEVLSGFVEKLGASPIFMPVGEVYLGIQKGVIDGTLGTIATTAINQKHWDEVAENVMVLWPFTSIDVLGMSPGAYEDLPPDFQEILMDEFEKYEDDMWERATDPEYYNDCLILAEERGLEVYEPPPELFEEMQVIAGAVAKDWLEMNRDFSPKAGREAEETLRAICEAVGGPACLALE